MRISTLARVSGAWLMLHLSTALAETEVPTADLKGLVDPPGLKRYAGSVLVYRDDVAYDELKLPTGKVEDLEKPYPNRAASGARVTLQYTVTGQRSSLEVVRNYQQQATADGFKARFECAGASCGSTGSGQVGYSLLMTMLPSTFAGFVGESSPAACGAYGVGDIRYALLEHPVSGAVLAVAAATPTISSTYCAQAWARQLTIWVARVEPKAREQQMIALSTAELGKRIDSDGRVALYGILFDTSKAVLKPESLDSIDRIAELLVQRPTLKLHVVGHTDNEGAFDANLALSRRRADAVVADLVTRKGIARTRLTANGVGSLAPLQLNATEEGRAKNRRVELVVQ